MLRDPRFWTALTLLFLSACSSAQLSDRLLGRRRVLKGGYGAAALLCSVGLWLSAPAQGSPFPPLLTGANGIAVLTGALAGLHVLFLLIPAAAPLLLSVVLDMPLKPLLPGEGALKGEDTYLGELTFLPSQGDRLSLVWEDDERELSFRLRGETASVYIMSCRTKPSWFFFRDRTIVLGIGSESLLPSELSDAGEETFYPLQDAPAGLEPFYRIHYPAPRSAEPGFFTSWLYSVEKGDIVSRRG